MRRGLCIFFFFFVLIVPLLPEKKQNKIGTDEKHFYGRKKMLFQPPRHMMEFYLTTLCE